MTVRTPFCLGLRRGLWRVLPLLLALTLAACGGDASEPDPGSAPRSNVPALRSNAVDSLVADTSESVPVPDLTMETLDGTTLALADPPGEVLLINFWATWCPPCRKEIPDLVDLQDELGPEGLQVIGIAFDQEGAEVVRPFVEEYAVNYPIVADTARALESHLGPIYALPTTLLVGPDGRIQQRVVGLFPVDDMRSRLRAMLSTGARPETADATPADAP